MGSIATTVTPLSGGVTGVVGVAKVYRMEYTGVYATDDLLKLALTDSATGVTTVVGAGSLANTSPNFVFTYNRKENLLAETTWFYSAISDPETFNDPNQLGNGFIDLSDSYSESVRSLAMAPFQGKLALFGNNDIQIWNIAADPSGYALSQVLDNIGTVAADSVKSFGEIDTCFLHSTGIRSLQVREASYNGLVIDVGSQIDLIVQEQLASATAAEIASACGIIDMANSQYWLFLKDSLYVLSRFPQAKIQAWSQWVPSYQAGVVDGLGFWNTTTNPIFVKFGFDNNVAHSQPSITVAGFEVKESLNPAKYLWVYDADGVLLATYEIPGGLDFSGQINFLAGNTFTTTPNQIPFVPNKFVSYNNQVFVSSDDAFFVYGGADKNTYDNSICSFETSWLDFNNPAADKNFHGVDVAQKGTWNHYASSDYLGQILQEVILNESNATFAGGKTGWTSVGTHAKYRMQTTGNAEKSVVSNLLIHYRASQSQR